MLFAACGRDRGDDVVARSLPLGTYDVGVPLCASTHQAPRYPAASYKLALFALDGLTAHTLTVAPDLVTEVMADDDCTLTVTRSVYRNYADEFTLFNNRSHLFTPDGCTLAAVIDEHAYPVGRAYTTALDDASSLEPEVPFAVSSPAAGWFELASLVRPDYDLVWAAFGCAKPDRILINLRPKSL